MDKIIKQGFNKYLKSHNLPDQSLVIKSLENSVVNDEEQINWELSCGEKSCRLGVPKKQAIWHP